MINEDNLHAFFDILPIGLWRQGHDKKFAWANNAFLQLTGYHLDELRTKETIALIKPSWRQFVLDRNKAILNGEFYTPYYFPTRTKKKDEMIVMGTVGRIDTHFYGGYIAPLYIDQERDALSGLFNEIHFYRKLRKDILYCYNDDGQPFTLMAIGIDRIKIHRQSLGICESDRFIRRVSDKILALTTEGSLPAHIAYGQFDILFPKPMGTSHEEMAQSLLDFANHESRSNLNIDISLSIAVVEYDQNLHEDMDRKLISHAHRAMFRIQTQGGNALKLGPEP